MSETAAFETPADAGQGEEGEVRLWLQAIDLARKSEEGWRKRAQDAVERYRDEKERTGERRFNILFANVQTVLPAIYNSTPVPDIRRRFGDTDPVGRVVAQTIERAASYQMDARDFDSTMRAGCWDMEVVGRGVARVKYEPIVEGERIVDEAVVAEYVDWRDFIVGPGRRWTEVPWIAFEHRLTREELTERFGEIGATMPLDFVQDGANKDDAPEVFKRGIVFEVWDKQRREVKFLARTVPEHFLSRADDPLRLQGFFPVPRPIYSIQDTGSLVPLVPYELYRDQAEELDRVTTRITALIAMVRWRGVRAAELAELDRLAEAKDGDFIAVDQWQQFVSTTGGGGLERALWMAPIDVLVSVIKELIVHREEIKRVIYEITGLSDIIRGASQAQETATAQRIKSQWGSLRIEDRQAEVSRFARDLLRLMSEIIAEKFQPDTLAVMTGINLPAPEMKAAAQARASVQAPQPGDEELLSTPTWDEVIQVMRSDALRSYRVDIETDSTIQADVARNMENAAQFVQGFGGFVQAVGPAVQAGFMPMDIASDLLTSLARNYKLGRQAEDALERLKQVKPPSQPGAEAAAQAEQAKAQAEMQKLQMEAQRQQQQTQIEMAKAQQQAEADAMDMELKREQHRMRMIEMQTKHQITMAELQARASMPQQPQGNA